MSFFQPERAVSGPSYGRGFKVFATLVTAGLFAYGALVAWRFPLNTFSTGVQLLLAASALLLLASCYWFHRARTTIDAAGIRQSGMVDKKVVWADVRGAKMIGIPFLGWLFPPRLVVRTGTAFATFNGGSQEVLVEFARISLAFQMKK